MIIALGGQPTKQSQSLPNQPTHIASLRPLDLNNASHLDHCYIVEIFRNNIDLESDQIDHKTGGLKHMNLSYNWFSGSDPVKTENLPSLKDVQG